jgi:hypothetical protein
MPKHTKAKDRISEATTKSIGEGSALKGFILINTSQKKVVKAKGAGKNEKTKSENPHE